MRSFYTATMNIVLVILKDYPQFLCDFHFNFVNSLPDHAIQLKNMILAAFPCGLPSLRSLAALVTVVGWGGFRM